MRFAELQLAVMALTRLPAGQIKGPVPSLPEAAWAFPLVGLLIGGIGAIFVSIHAGFALAVMVLATGALHEDGLADCADGLGGRDKTRRLEIMRDSRIGSYGVVALVLVLGLRWQALETVQPLNLIACAMVSRSLVPFALHLMPPARSDGLGAAASGKVPTKALWFAGGMGLAAMALGGTLPALAAALTTALLVAGVAHRRIGGQTGDVLGAMVILSETAALLTLA